MAKKIIGQHEIYVGDKIDEALEEMGFDGQPPESDVIIEVFGNYMHVVVTDGTL